MYQGYIGREYQEIMDPQHNNIIKLDLRFPPLIIDFNKKQHYFILAKSGKGKSYTGGVLVEEIIQTMENYGSIIVDPMGIYSTLKHANTKVAEIERWNKMCYKPEVIPEGMKNVEIWIPEGDTKNCDNDMYDHAFSLKANQLSYGTLCYCFDLDPLDQMVNLFRKCQNQMNKSNPEYTLGMLKSAIASDGPELGFKQSTIEALNSRLDALSELGLISSKGIQLHEMIAEQRVVVFDLSLSSKYTAKIVVNFLAEALLSQRKIITKKLLKAQQNNSKIEIPNYIPPTLLVLDEAHNFIPNNPTLKCFIKEGRNVGCMMCAISQTPDLTPDVYNNITHLFVGQLIYDDDIQNVRAMMPIEKSAKDVRTQFRNLTSGCFYYYNMDEKTEKRIMIRARKTLHPASTELQDERKYLLSHFISDALEAQLYSILKENSPMPISKLSPDMRMIARQMAIANKLKIIDQEEQTVVQLT
jgi:hypothetical protein